MRLIAQKLLCVLVLFFYYLAFAFLLTLTSGVFLEIFVVSRSLLTVLNFILPILIMIIAFKLVIFLTYQTLTYNFKIDYKVIILVTVFHLILNYGLVAQAYLRTITFNYPEVLIKTSIKVLWFFLAVNIIWLDNKFKLVPKILKN